MITEVWWLRCSHNRDEKKVKPPCSCQTSISIIFVVFPLKWCKQQHVGIGKLNLNNQCKMAREYIIWVLFLCFKIFIQNIIYICSNIFFFAAVDWLYIRCTQKCTFVIFFVFHLWFLCSTWLPDHKIFEFWL